MSALPEAVLRWARLQRDLGTEEVALDAVWTPPAAPAKGRAPAPVRPAAAQPQAPAPMPQRRPAAPVLARAPSIPPPQPLRPEPVPRAPVRSGIPAFADLAGLCAHAAGCTRCTLHGRRRSVLATGGPDRSSWAVLTLYAWGEDAERKQILSGEYARPLLDLAREVGLPPPAAAAVFACTPDDPSDTTIQGFTEAVRCRGHWLQRLKLSGARAVLVLDHKATSLARGPQHPVEWPAFRGTPWEIDGIAAVSTHHPARMTRSEALRGEVESDLRQILSLVGA